MELVAEEDVVDAEEEEEVLETLEWDRWLFCGVALRNEERISMMPSSSSSSSSSMSSG